VVVGGSPVYGEAGGKVVPNIVGGISGIINKIKTLSASAATRSYVDYTFPVATQIVLTDAPNYTQQTVSPDGGNSNTSTWTFAAQKAGTGVVTSMTVTDHLGNSSITATTIPSNLPARRPHLVPLRELPRPTAAS
jgi:hypothetical protein